MLKQKWASSKAENKNLSRLPEGQSSKVDSFSADSFRVIEMEVLFNHGKPNPNNNGLTARELAERQLDNDIMSQTPMQAIQEDLARNLRLANGDTAKARKLNAELSEPMRARTESLLLDLKAKSKDDFLRLTLIEERLALFKPGMATH